MTIAFEDQCCGLCKNFKVQFNTCQAHPRAPMASGTGAGVIWGYPPTVAEDWCGEFAEPPAPHRTHV